jgi:hypothetical protein
VPLPDGGDARLAGALADVIARDDALWWSWIEPTRDPKSLDFKSRLDLFWHYALLRLSDRAIARPVRLAVLLKKDDARLGAEVEALEQRFAAARDAGDAATLDALHADLGARIGQLVDLYRRARRAVVPYWPKTSWAAAEGKLDLDAVWSGSDSDSGGGPGERDFAPGHARLLARGLDPTRDPRVLIEARRLRDLLDLATLGAAR